MSALQYIEKEKYWDIKRRGWWWIHLKKLIFSILFSYLFLINCYCQPETTFIQLNFPDSNYIRLFNYKNYPSQIDSSLLNSKKIFESFVSDIEKKWTVNIYSIKELRKNKKYIIKTRLNITNGTPFDAIANSEYVFYLMEMKKRRKKTEVKSIKYYYSEI